ncbi:MAG: acetyl-CoA synthase subunit gamma [Clostridiales bacterium]|nr:acetyl-CoA synthase subunit gamma [Clostridiales bacterium]
MPNGCTPKGCCCDDNHGDVYPYPPLSHCIEKYIKTSVGDVAVVKTTLDAEDKLGAFRVRIGIKRDDYRVNPGVYAVGNPDDSSPVLVSANYKLSFDALRKELSDVNAWIVVIDTKGINVWCAAGKGTFGTEEIISKINNLQIAKLVSHKKIILPQLGAPGVQAHIITKQTGFKVVFGPVRAQDIKAFLENNMIASRAMRTVLFSLKDRIIIIPVELVTVSIPIPIFYVFFIIYNLISKQPIVFGEVLLKSLLNIIPFVGAILLGTVFVPILLPIIPFRAFSLKGLVIGVIGSVVTMLLYPVFMLPESILFMIATVLLMLVITSYLALNFTGTSTYTSFSGAELETQITFPIAIVTAIIGVVLMIVVKILEFV